MTTFLLTLSLFGVAMAAMAIGVILSDRKLHGSCGGPDSDDCLCAIEKRKICALAKQAEKKGLSTHGFELADDPPERVTPRP